MIQSNLSRYDFILASIVSKEYELLKKRGLLNEIFDLLENALQTKPHTVIQSICSMGIFILDSDTANGSLTQEYLRIRKDVINSLDEEKHTRYYFALKLSIEQEIAQQHPSQEWEKLRIENINDHNTIVLFGSCDKCKEEYPILVDNSEYWGRRRISDCLKCSGEKTLTISYKIPGRPLRLIHDD